LKTFLLQSTKKKRKSINRFSTQNNRKINIISKRWYPFYLFFRFSTDIRKRINQVEKETINIFDKRHLKTKTINARNLLKSFQPIHRLIIIRNILQLIKSLKLKKKEY